jgi:transcriptional regulator
MYTPTSFRQTDRERLFALIESYSFGTLVVPDGTGGAEISHLPFVLDRDRGPHGTLRLHVARANPIWKLALERQRAVAVFSGPHAYISPRWYEPAPANVPTWNYAVAHVHGSVTGPMADAELLALLERLVDVHERGAEAPWEIANVDPTARQQLLKAIVGLSIAIEHIEGKFKLSQNRPEADQRRVRAALLQRGGVDDGELARLMRLE